MSDPIPDEEMRAWHRRFASECNNRAWSLSESPTRSAADDREMLLAAHAAAFHWDKIGTEIQAARADMLLGQVHALLGHGNLAMSYARSAFSSVTSRESANWEIALAHAVLANAASAAVDPAIHARHYALASAIGLSLPNAEERRIFEASFSRVPIPAAPAQ